MKTSLRLMKPTVAAILAVLITLQTGSLRAASGALDTSFDSDGIATANIGGGAYGNAMAIQDDGKIVIVGQYFNAINYDVFVMRLNANGTPDASFGGSGIVTKTVGPAEDNATGVAIQSNGKIVVVGYTNNGAESDFLVLRYNANGTPDTSFSGDGMVTTNFDNTSAFAPFNDVAKGVAIQSDGKIVVVGKSDTVGGIRPNYDFAVARYNPNGSLDSSFSGDGKVITPIRASHDDANCVAIQSNGKIVVAGESVDSVGNRNFAVARYTTAGALDTSFSGDGKLTTVFSGFIDVAYGVAIEPSGKIIVAGGVNNGTRDFFGVARYLPNGALDTTFSGDGRLTTSFGSGDGQAFGVAVQASGKIVCAGTGSGKIVVTRYHSGGGLDRSFGSGGIVTTPIGSSDSASAVSIQEDGRIVVAGQNYNGSTNVVTAIRYLSLPQADTRLGTSSSVPTGNDKYNLTGIGQVEIATIRHGGGVKSYIIGIQNDGAQPDSFTVRGTPGNGLFSVTYFSGGQDVTAAVVGGTFITGTLNPGVIRRLTARIKATTTLTGQRRELSISSTSNTGNSKDVAKIKVTSN